MTSLYRQLEMTKQMIDEYEMCDHCSGGYWQSLAFNETIGKHIEMASSSCTDVIGLLKGLHEHQEKYKDT